MKRLLLIIVSFLILPLIGDNSAIYYYSDNYNVEKKLVNFNKTPLPNKALDSIDKLIEAMIWVESVGNDSAYNKKEKAAGCLQIRPIMLREINRIVKKYGGVKYTKEDRYNRKKSIEIFKLWVSEYHKGSSYEKIARNWNGGPKGYKRKKTLIHWEKVKKYIKNGKDNN